MKRIVMVYKNYRLDFETEVNQWLRNLPGDILDIKYEFTVSPNSGQLHYTAMIIYEDGH